MESLIEALYALAEAPASGGEGHERAAFGAAGRVVSRRELMFQPFSGEHSWMSIVRNDRHTSPCLSAGSIPCALTIPQLSSPSPLPRSHPGQQRRPRWPHVPGPFLPRLRRHCAVAGGAAGAGGVGRTPGDGAVGRTER